MLKIKSFTFNALQENTYVVYDDATNHCILVDPGCYDKAEGDALIAYIAAENLKVDSIINTHCHIDHVLGNYRMKEQYKTKLIIHRVEEAFLNAAKTYSSNYGFNQYQEATPDAYLDEKDMVTIGNETLEVLFVPGHSPGHIALYYEAGNWVLAGDVLFRNSIGRTDLPGGNQNTLLRSIQHVLFQLPDETVVYSGHGQETTIGYEKKHNPYCAVN